MRVEVHGWNDELEEQIVVIRFQSAIPSGRYALSIAYASMMRTDLMGCYLSYAKDTSGAEHLYIVSQFESNYARTCFPTFDEPSVKMPFLVQITAPAEYRILFNTPAVAS